MTSNRQASEVFRDRVLLHLHQAGLHGASTLTPTASRQVPIRGKAGVLLGLPWLLSVRTDNRRTPDLSEAVNNSRALAQHLGVRTTAAVINRNGHEIGDCYIVTTLDDLIVAFGGRVETRRSA